MHLTITLIYKRWCNKITLGVFLWAEKVTAIPNTDTRWCHWVELRVDGRSNDGGKLWVCPAAVVSIFTAFCWLRESLQQMKCLLSLYKSVYGSAPRHNGTFCLVSSPITELVASSFG